MAYNNSQAEKRKKELIENFAEALNQLEAEFMEPEENFNKSAASFTTGRIEAMFIELGDLLGFWDKEKNSKKKST